MSSRRLRSLIGALLGVLIIISIQRLQGLSEQTQPISSPYSTPVSSSSPSVSTSSSIEVILITTSTRLTPNARVVRVVDGDTLVVQRVRQTQQEKVRLIGINTPESVDPRRTVQCFGKEASAHMRDWLEGKEVFLESDVQADERDKYQRFLRNVFLPADERAIDVNASLVAQGYAQAYTDFPMNKARKQQLIQLQQKAKAEQRGLWKPEICVQKKTRKFF